MTQAEILAALETSRAAPLAAIEGLSPEQLLAPKTIGEWSVRDVLQHLSLWEAELVRMFVALEKGRRPTGEGFVAHPDYDAINARWHAATKDRPLDRVLDDWHAVRRQVLRWVQGFSDDDLSRPRTEAWMRGRPLWRWIAGYTFRHEQEHTEPIRAWRRGLER